MCDSPTGGGRHGQHQVRTGHRPRRQQQQLAQIRSLCSVIRGAEPRRLSPHRRPGEWHGRDVPAAYVVQIGKKQHCYVSKRQRWGGVAATPSYSLWIALGWCMWMCVCVCVHVYRCDGIVCVLVMTTEWLHCVSVAGPVASAVRKWPT